MPQLLKSESSVFTDLDRIKILSTPPVFLEKYSGVFVKNNAEHNSENPKTHFKEDCDVFLWKE